VIPGNLLPEPTFCPNAAISRSEIYVNSSEINCEKTGLDRDKPGYSGIKIKIIFFITIFQRSYIKSHVA
jgi:hypothetical protein